MSYLQEYKDFLLEYKKGSTDGERAGELIAIMAQHFATANYEYAKSLIAYNNISSAIEQKIDENGKAISSAKAKILSSATEESSRLINSKVDLENIQEIINALKALQRGIMNEFSHSSNI